MSDKQLTMFSIPAALSALVLTSAACHSHKHDLTATDVQVSHMERSKSQYGRHLTDMSDNAILQDMSVADFHFVPHTAEISGTGADRLNRMAVLLSTYGGIVRYETELRDQELINKRLDHVREYLTVAGTNMDRVQVKSMVSGGRGMPAEKAIEVERKGTAKPAQGSGAPAMMMAPSGR